MSAKEMFRQLEFECITTFEELKDNKHRVYRYKYHNGYKLQEAYINFISNKYEIWFAEDNEMISVYIYADLHNAIHQQLIELGWI
jgi:hypothetical protein